MPAPELLLIEDEMLMRQALRFMLEDLGYRVREAVDGPSGLEACRVAIPDLILMDVRMPGMDGMEVCARLQQDEALREIPVIFLSGLQDPEERVRAFQVGAVDFITKPFIEAEVEARIRLHLQIQAQRRALDLQNAQLTRSLEETQELNRTLVELNERLRASEELKGRFLALMRNEINDPLAAILAAGRELGDPRLPADRVASLLEIINAEALGLDFRLRNIFCAAELEAGDACPVPACVALGTVFQDVLDSFASGARAQGVELRLEAPEGEFLGDAEMLRTIVANLVSNGLKFNHSGGSVTLKAGVDPDGLHIEVEDTGTGIRPEEQGRVFERFHQGEEGLTRGFRGQGLGLSVVQALVELLGGELSLESEEGRGTTVRCRIPAVPDPASNPRLARDGNLFFFGDPEADA